MRLDLLSWEMSWELLVKEERMEMSLEFSDEGPLSWTTPELLMIVGVEMKSNFPWPLSGETLELVLVIAEMELSLDFPHDWLRLE